MADASASARNCSVGKVKIKDHQKELSMQHSFICKTPPPSGGSQDPLTPSEAAPSSFQEQHTLQGTSRGLDPSIQGCLRHEPLPASSWFLDLPAQSSFPILTSKALE